jgi:hypothetical protein
MKHEGNLTIRTTADAKKYAGLTAVSGDLSINAEAKLDAPKLESVGGNLSIGAEAKLDAPKLESVGGYLSIGAEAKLDALKSVGGYLSIGAEAKLDALKSVGGDLYIYAKAKLDAPKLYAKGFDAFKVYDNIACIVLSSKTKADIEILACRHARIKQQKIVGEKFFVAKKGDKTAHAETIKEALEELQFKIGTRNVGQYKNMPLHTRKTPKEWALVYRTITGAYQFGTQHFMEAKGQLKKNYTLAEILEETKGAFGHSTFLKTVSGDQS